MQTFLPNNSFAVSAALLDNKRLGKQRVETLQIVNAHLNPEYGWQHHPATNMWRGWTPLLIQYGVCVCDEWIDRGFNDTVRDKLGALIDDAFRVCESNPDPWWSGPSWLGDPHLHASHRAMLWRKDPVFYANFVGTFDNSIDGYVWPSPTRR